MSAPGGIGYGPDRHAANGLRGVVAGDTDEPFGVGVVRLELVVAERPVDDVGAVDRPELGARVEVDFAKPRQFAVGVESAAADRRREVVDLAGPVAVVVVVGVAERARFEQGIGSEEVPGRELDLVVAHVPEGPERRLELEQVVAALLEHDHRPPGLGEDMGRGGAARTRPDDHHVGVDGSLLTTAHFHDRCSRGVGRRRRTGSPASLRCRGCRRTPARRSPLARVPVEEVL